MNRPTPAVPVALVLAAASFAAFAADEAPKAAAPVTATAASSAPSTAASPTAPAGKVAASASASNDPALHRLVCLNMSLQCFAMNPQTEDSSAKSRTASLDLKAPDIRRVAPANILYAATDEPVEIEEQQVQVEGTRPEVYVPGGLASLPWAVMHPTQAWRIFMPVPPSAAK